MLQHFVEAATAISGTAKKSVKETFLADYFAGLDDATLERAVVFFTGSPFPRKEERVTGVGWATIAEAICAVTGCPADSLHASAGKEGDLGDGVVSLFLERKPSLTVVELGEFFNRIAATSGKAAKTAVLQELFDKATGPEARFIVKILQNELRIGLQEGLVESAIARAFGEPLERVRRAHMFNGDLGVTALLARSHALETVQMTLFHPIGLMLAQPEEDPQAIVDQLGAGAFADDKYDGIRAQIHTDGKGAVRIYSRTLDSITDRFPEIGEAAASLTVDAIFDGEIVAFRDHILPFAVLQQRIGRRKVSEKLRADAPVVFFAFDLLYRKGEPLFERPLRERLSMMRGLLQSEGVIRPGHQVLVHNGAEVDAAFDAARERINEGLVVKDPESLYTPGRRGKAWLKYKKALATLDCVVTAAELGHGKRRGVLSDYTFAVRHEGQLLNIGKAYSGLTDVEIAAMTERFTAITTARYGPVHVVRPEVVLEIAFDRIQESARHKSGYAMRFPRIAQIRDDKTVEEISTLDDVRRIYEGQLIREKKS